jgi:hypothetical protein
MDRIERPTDERWTDFRNFLVDVWDHLNLPTPTWLQLDISRWLSNPEAPKRFILEAFRGVGKSWLTVAFVIWLLYWHPEYNIMVVSASKQAADEFSTFCLRLIREMDGLQHMQPRDGQRDSKISFDVAEAPAAKAPSVKSLGITSQLTGGRADIIIADDVEIPSNSLTQTMRVKLSEQVKEFDAILKPGAHCRIIFLGTPQCEQSVYNELQKRGYITRIWPSRYPNEEEMEEYGKRIAPSITKRLAQHPGLVGQPTDPSRFTDLDLRERALSYGAAGYAMQFQLRTRLSDLERYPLKVRDLIVMDCDPEKAPEKPIWCNDKEHLAQDIENAAMPGDYFYRPMQLVGKWLDYTGSVMVIDPSGRGKDETGYAVVKMLNGYLYVLECGGLAGGYEEPVLIALSTIAQRHKVNHLIIEANFGDGMYSALLKPVLAKFWNVSIEELKHSVQKEKRICDTLEPVMNSHRLVLSPQVIQDDLKSIEAYPLEIRHQYSLIYQMTRITREKGALAHDDRLDALSMAVMYWVEQMAQDADESQREHKAELLQADLDKFMTQVIGHASTPSDHWSPYML